MVLKKGTFTHFLFNKSVTLHNVPYYQCTNCSNSFYQSDKKVEYKLEETLIKGLSESDFEQ
jgi:hypothetical protein